MAPLSWCVPCSTSDIIGREKERKSKAMFCSESTPDMYGCVQGFVWLCLGFTLGRFFGVPFICKRGNTDSKIRDLSLPLLQRASAGEIYKDLWLLGFKHLCRRPPFSNLAHSFKAAPGCAITASLLHCTLSFYFPPGAQHCLDPPSRHTSRSVLDLFNDWFVDVLKYVFGVFVPNPKSLSLSSMSPTVDVRPSHSATRTGSIVQQGPRGHACTICRRRKLVRPSVLGSVHHVTYV